MSKNKDTSVFTARMRSDTKAELIQLIDTLMKKAGLHSKSEAYSLLIDLFKENELFFNSTDQKLPDIKAYIKAIDLSLDTVDQARVTINQNLKMILVTYAKVIQDLITENEKAKNRIRELETEVKNLEKELKKKN